MPFTGALLAATLICLSCVCHTGYQGITERTPDDQPAGKQDPDDWRPDGIITECHFYPNPVADRGHLVFSLAAEATVSCSLNASQTRRVCRIVDRSQYPAGEHIVQWSCCDDWGQLVPEGIYRLFLDAVAGGARYGTYGDVAVLHEQ